LDVVPFAPIQKRHHHSRVEQKIDFTAQNPSGVLVGTEISNTGRKAPDANHLRS